jgi:hypothetical protein
MGTHQRLDQGTATKSSAVAISADRSTLNQVEAHLASAHTSRLCAEPLARILAHRLSGSNHKQTLPTTANRSSWSSSSYSEGKEEEHANRSSHANTAATGHQVQQTVTNGNWSGLDLAGPPSSSPSCYSQDEGYQSVSSPGVDTQAAKGYASPSVPIRLPPSPPLTFETGAGEYYSPRRRRSAEVAALQTSPPRQHSLSSDQQSKLGSASR